VLGVEWDQALQRGDQRRGNELVLVMLPAVVHAMADRRQARVEPAARQPGEQRPHGRVEVGHIAQLVEQQRAVGIDDAQPAAGQADPLHVRHRLDPLALAHLALAHLVQRSVEAGRAQVERQEAHQDELPGDQPRSVVATWRTLRSPMAASAAPSLLYRGGAQD
jgi:hypothetical protein